jgi:4-amino-4-deoxy-L-arabinose transferase-like glycosyltransferase
MSRVSLEPTRLPKPRFTFLALTPGKLDVPLLLALPWLIFVTIPDWFYTPPGFIDSWFYLGHFLRFPQFMRGFGPSYYGSRLPWNLVGHLIHQLFPPLVANAVLHIGVSSIAVVCLYAIIRRTLSRPTALVTSVLMGTYSYFLAAAGWDYVDGVGIVYCLVTLLCITQATKQPRRWLWLNLAGLSFGALIHTNLMWLLLAPSFLIYYGLTSWQVYPKWQRWVGLGWVSLGSVLMTGALGLINWAYGGQFIFFKPSVDMALHYDPSHFARPLSEWLPSAYWLVLPGLVGLTSLVRWFWQQGLRAPWNWQSCGFVLMLLCSLLILGSFDLRNRPGLQLPYYASYLIPFWFLTLAALLDPVVSRCKGRSLGLLVSLLVLGGLLSLRIDWVLPLVPMPLFLGIYLVSGVVCLGQHWRIRAVGMPLIAALLVSGYTLFFWTNQTHAMHRLPECYQTTCNSRPMFIATAKANQILQQIDPNVQVRFWYNAGESYVYQAISSTNLFEYRLLGEGFPSLVFHYKSEMTPKRLERLQEFFKTSPTVAILSNRPQALAEANQTLQPMGYVAQPLGQYPISQDAVNFVMTMVRIVPR